MILHSTRTGLVGKAVLALLLVSFVSSGIPMAKVHSHENAEFGHSHETHEFFDNHGVDETDSEDGDAGSATLHVHDLDATSSSIISSVSMEFAVVQYAHSHMPPPQSRLPDKIIAPLYRPPIA